MVIDFQYNFQFQNQYKSEISDMYLVRPTLGIFSETIADFWIQPIYAKWLES